jgi:sodium/potassium/calcium exchanger 6
MAGVTFLALGNGSPDVFSTFAAMKTHSGSLAVGELIGAAGFITAVVAGSMALVRPFKVARKSFVRDVGFFIVAASFSMLFLADGRLYLWECAVMVGFYLFYVVTVVVWHWYLGRRGRRKRTEAAARGHFYVPGSEEAEPEPYHDEEENGPPRRSRTASTISRGVSADDFAALERGGSPLPRMREDIDPEEDDATRDHWLAEISNNMRINRPRPGERRNTGNPIRPSLVGALEFRAVLSSLQKSRNIQSMPINLRRYSDDPAYTLAQQQANLSSASSPIMHYEDVDARAFKNQSPQRLSAEYDRDNSGARVRAVSVNDAAGLRLDLDVFQRLSVPNEDLLGPSPPASARLQVPQADSASGSRRGSQSQVTPHLSIQPPQGDFGYLATSPGAISSADYRSPNLLAPPSDDFPGFSSPPPPQDRTTKDGQVHQRQSKMSLPRPSDTQVSSPASPFPEYRDDPNRQLPSRTSSLRLPPPSIGSDSPFNQHIFHNVDDKPIQWWPYKVLPPPQVFASTLFPTLYSWRDKNIWEKLLGIVSAPSVFVLAITLPVVETEQEDDDVPEAVDPDPGLLSPEHARSRSHSIAILPPDSPLSSPLNNETDSLEPRTTNQGRHGNHGIGAPTSNPKPCAPPPTSPPAPPPSSPKDWNRWLVATQIFTAPLFIVLILWANTSPTLSPATLLLHSLYALLASTLTLALLLLTTTPSHPPRSRPLLCFLGFAVSIAWISTIANEVVGVLKALGVILGISDAILGLTIFAVGNSLGDLVADITVARLGYPVMALSACFGGPMLNILLGVGISGLYMTIRGGESRYERHPDRPVIYKPYHIEVGQTLVISGVTLLVTLLGLLIVVPMSGWWMSRRIGVGLVVLWGVSTVGNVVVEVAGWGGDVA